ncbi:hypothetical protein, partial [Streptomyces halstedii]|uniref:hypothetical protein n=1 Tax=Streptomyces halstedii TaxID=1944 RepID=UPI0033ADE71A
MRTPDVSSTSGAPLEPSSSGQRNDRRAARPFGRVRETGPGSGDMFNAMMEGIKEESVGYLFNLEV